MPKRMSYLALDVLNCIADSLDFFEDYINKCKNRKELEKFITQFLKKKDYVIKRTSVTGIINTVIDVKSMQNQRTVYTQTFLEKRPKDLFRLQLLVGKVSPKAHRVVYAVGFIPAQYSIVKNLTWGASNQTKFVYAFTKGHENLKMPEDMENLLNEWSSPSGKKFSKSDLIFIVSRLLLGGFFEYEFID